MTADNTAQSNKVKQDEPTPLIFYALLRESSPGQKDKYGPLAQRRDMDKFAATWPGGPHVIRLTTTVIESATKWQRPIWEQAITEGIRRFKAGEVNAFLFGRVDRETRNPFASVPIMKLALDAGVKVFFAQDRFCLDPHDFESIKKYADEIQEAMAYISRFKKLTAPGRVGRAKYDQKHPTNTKMFGFDLVDGKRVLDQAQAEAIREAVQIALKVGRPGPAARWLNQQGWRTTRNKPFTPTTLAGKKGLFRNRALIGETTINFKDEPEPVAVHHDRILDDVTFEQLQVMLDGRKLRQQRSEVFQPLSGVAFCECGARVAGDKIRNHRFYRCSRRPSCGAKSWDKDELEYQVYQAFSHYLQHLEDKRLYLELAQQSQTKLESELSNIEQQIKENNREWRILLEKDLANYPDLIISEKKRELTATRQSLLQAQAETKAKLAVLPQLDPAEVQAALKEVAKSWMLAVSNDRVVAGSVGAFLEVKSWEKESVVEGTTKPDVPRKITEDQGRLLRETLLRLNCRITVFKGAVVVRGNLPLGVRAKQGASGGAGDRPRSRPALPHGRQKRPGAGGG